MVSKKMEKLELHSLLINRMAPEVIREEYYNESIDMWSLGITIIEMMDRVPPHYLIKDEEELFDIIATEPSPTFTYSRPSMYMRGLVAWLLDEEASTIDGCFLTVFAR
jgi:serine/threonine protein kinase